MPARRRPPATIRRVERASGRLASAALARMEETLPWFRAMPAEHRSWIGLVAQAGIAAFVRWYRRPDGETELTGEVFATAPRELTRSVTLAQTVEMVRVTIEVVEARVPELAAPGEEGLLREAVLHYSREIAFAAARVYAQAAEERGAWDARLEALVVGALLRGEVDEALLSRAAALGWTATGAVAVLVGYPPAEEPEAVVANVRRAARHAGIEVLVGVQGDRLVTVLGGTGDPVDRARQLAAEFGPGPLVLGPPVPDLRAAPLSAQAALAGLRAAGAWPHAPRPVPADDLLPERAVAGDLTARRQLVEQVYRPLVAAGTPLLETVSTYLEQSGSLERTARSLFVHPNTVRYRLGKAADLTALLASHPRDAFTLQIALVLGRLAENGEL
jgi:DNA-binding PucR family transcriptional regulator